MDVKKTPENDDERIRQLVEALAGRAELTQRLLAIAKLVHEPVETGRIRNAHEVESLLIEAVRNLGNETLVNWAESVDSILGDQLKAQKAGTQMREKKLKWWSVFGCVRARESVWRHSTSCYVRPLPGALAVSSRSCSLPLQRAVCDFGMESSFQQAAKRVQQHYGFALPLSAVADISREHARAITAKQEARDGAHRLPARGAETIVAEAYGSFLRIVSTDQARADRRKSRKVGYQEARLCAASAQGSDRICLRGDIRRGGQHRPAVVFRGQRRGHGHRQ